MTTPTGYPRAQGRRETLKSHTETTAVGFTDTKRGFSLRKRAVFTRARSRYPS
jgi:hypothetical protein